MENSVSCQSNRHIHARSGWSAAEEELLRAETARALQEGTPLRQAFEAVACRTNRRPNSVRNYYYTALRSGQDKPARPPFRPFTPQESRHMLTQMLTWHSQGKSVRACAYELAGGDRTLMLRYQNKYRALMKSRPPLVRQVLTQLEGQGVPAPAPPAAQEGDLARRVAGEVTQRLTAVLQQSAVQTANDRLEDARAQAKWYERAARRLAVVTREYLHSRDPHLLPMVEECIAESLEGAPGEMPS
ncbi:MAG: hypothetical protein PHD32_08705 [Eubacteriales bacterium]|nr:hypothetical protein [Eubacteriales bacterium]